MYYELCKIDKIGEKEIPRILLAGIDFSCISNLFLELRENNAKEYYINIYPERNSYCLLRVDREMKCKFFPNVTEDEQN